MDANVSAIKKILLVSSSVSFLDRNISLLRHEGFKVVTAQSGADALLLHKERAFDLVLSDLHLFDMGGDALTKSLRNIEGAKKASVVLICYDNTEDRIRVAKCSADAQIVRPLKAEIILETVGNLLNIQIGRPKRVLFTVKVLSRKEGKEFDCISIDISITGILLESEHSLSIGDRITCKFSIPGLSEIETDGDVVRSVRIMGNTHKYGIQFVGLSYLAKRDIESYVESIFKKQIVKRT